MNKMHSHKGFYAGRLFLAAFKPPVVLTGLNYFLCIIFLWSLVEDFRLFMKSEREQTCLGCTVCWASTGEDLGLE